MLTCPPPALQLHLQVEKNHRRCFTPYIWHLINTRRLSPFLSTTTRTHIHTHHLRQSDTLCLSVYLPFVRWQQSITETWQGNCLWQEGWNRARRILLPSTDVGSCGKARRQVNKPRQVVHGAVVSTQTHTHTHTHFHAHSCKQTKAITGINVHYINT